MAEGRWEIGKGEEREKDEVEEKEIRERQRWREESGECLRWKKRRT